jgi:hypothetical protein
LWLTATVLNFEEKSMLFPSHLNVSDLDGTNGFRIDGVSSGDSSGFSVSFLGDVNGDRIDDLVIGAPQGNTSYVVFGNRQGFASNFNLSVLDGSNGFRIEGEASRDFAGVVSNAGDINNDGLDDILVGGRFADPGGRSNAGAT